MYLTSEQLVKGFHEVKTLLSFFVSNEPFFTTAALESESGCSRARGTDGGGRDQNVGVGSVFLVVSSLTVVAGVGMDVLAASSTTVAGGGTDGGAVLRDLKMNVAAFRTTGRELTVADSCISLSACFLRFLFSACISA